MAPAAGFTPGKRDRIVDTLNRYAKGEKLREIADGQRDSGLRHGNGRFSDDMKEAEATRFEITPSSVKEKKGHEVPR